MNYTVLWEPPSEDNLTEVWLAAPDRAAVTAAVHQLDSELKRHPFDIGESRDSPLSRTAFAPPLGIEYEIIEDDKKVRVLRVWSIT